MGNSIEIGKTATDSITGFTGVVTHRNEALYASTQVYLQPRAKADGSFIEGQWFVEARVTEVAS
jgi:hypothetical protein